MDIIGTLDRDVKIADLQYGLSNFDDIRNALLTVFQLCSTEGWIKVMNNHRDADGNALPVFYFLIVIIICAFVMTNLVIAILFETFSGKQKRSKNSKEFELLMNEVEGMEELPEHLKHLFLDKTYYIHSLKSQVIFKKELVALFKPLKAFKMIKVPDTQYYKRACSTTKGILYKIVNYPLFEFLIFCIQLFNIAVLCIPKYDIKHGKSKGLLYTDDFQYLFIFLFFFEFIMRFIAYENFILFESKSAQLDAVLIVLTMIQVSLPHHYRSFDIIRQVRILRYSYFSLMFKSINDTLKELYLYILVIVIVWYIFAVIGIQLFIEEIPDEIRANFNSFGDSALTAFKILVAENWDEIMHQVVVHTSRWSALYFVLFIIIGQTIMLNLLLAIIITEFNSARLVSVKMRAIKDLQSELDKGKTMFGAIEIVLGKKYLGQNYRSNTLNQEVLMQSINRKADIFKHKPLNLRDYDKRNNDNFNPFDHVRNFYKLRVRKAPILRRKMDSDLLQDNIIRKGLYKKMNLSYSNKESSSESHSYEIQLNEYSCVSDEISDVLELGEMDPITPIEQMTKFRSTHDNYLLGSFKQVNGRLPK